LEVEVRKLFKRGNYSKEETIVFLLFIIWWWPKFLHEDIENVLFEWVTSLKNKKIDRYIALLIKQILLYLIIFATIFYGRKTFQGWKTIQGRKLFKGGNYSREETIQGRKLLIFRRF
jgi:hypothetical protein